MDNQMGEEESPFFLQALQGKRYLPVEDEEDPMSKRSKMTPYSLMSNSPGTSNSNSDPLPLMHPHPSSHLSHMPMQSQSHHTSTYPSSNYGSSLNFGSTYPTQGSTGSSMSGSSFNLPFLSGNSLLPPPTNHPSSNQASGLDYRFPSSPMMPSSQVYYFSSPPYLPRPASGYPQITTLQPGSNPSLQSPLTQVLHGVPMDSDHPYESPMTSLSSGLGQSMYKFGPSSGLSTLASLASGNSDPIDDPLSQSAFYSTQPTEKKTKKSVPKHSSNADAPNKKKEGLEESSVRILSLLQTKGKMIFKEIHETLNIDYRRAYDILNILLTTSLITKTGKKRENKLPFIYGDGTPLPEPVELREVMGDITREEEINNSLKSRIAVLEQELAKDEPYELQTDRPVE